MYSHKILPQNHAPNNVRYPQAVCIYAWSHANPSQGPPAVNKVAQSQHDQHADAKEQGLKSGQASSNAEVNCF